MNKELKKEAAKELRLSECCHSTFENDDGVTYCEKCKKFCQTIVDEGVQQYIDRATLAERKRCVKIANEHKCTWDNGCLDENANGDVYSAGCQPAIATAIEKGEEV